MPPDQLSFKRALRIAFDDPLRALVLLWQHVHVQGNLETGLNRPLCERQADEGRLALERGQTLPSIHPAAALRAVDLYLAGLSLGHGPIARKVVMSAGAEGTFWVISRRTGWSSRIAESQCGHPEYWLRHFQVVPAAHKGITISVRPAPRTLVKPSNKNLAFLAGGFLDGVLPDWNATSPFRCQVLKDPTLRWSSVEALLSSAAKAGAAIVVLPELTVDAEVRERIRTWLRETTRESQFALVVAGSFHEDRGGARRNVAYVFDDDGNEVLQHVKLRPMRAMPDEEWVEEDIEGGALVSLMHAWFGLVGVAICLDFCECGNVPVTDLWRETGPALMLIPSMGTTPTNSAHRRKTEELARLHGTVAVVASQHGQIAEAFGILFDGSKTTHEDRPLLNGKLPWTHE